MMICNLKKGKFKKIVEHFEKKGMELDKSYSPFDSVLHFYSWVSGGWEKKVTYNVENDTYLLENAYSMKAKRYRANLG